MMVTHDRRHPLRHEAPAFVVEARWLTSEGIARNHRVFVDSSEEAAEEVAAYVRAGVIESGGSITITH